MNTCQKHPDRKAIARGFCGACYNRWRIENTEKRCSKHSERPAFARGLCHYCYRQQTRSKPCVNHPERLAVAHGLCGGCYWKLRIENNPLIRESENAFRRRLYDERKSVGQCTRCSARAEVGVVLCSTCSDNTLHSYEKRKANKLCVNCGSEIDRLGVVCLKCRGVAQARYKNRKVMNLCTLCGQATRGTVRCDKCLENDKRVRVALIAAGLCSDGCGRKAVEGRQKSSECLARDIWHATKKKAKRDNYSPLAMSLDDFVIWYLDKKSKTTCCEWCNGPFTARGPIVEHDHNTGSIRALVCHSCNVLEGYGIDRLNLVAAKIDEWSNRKIVYREIPSTIAPQVMSDDVRRSLSILRSSKNSAKKYGHRPISMSLNEFAEWYKTHLVSARGYCEWCREPFDKRGPVVDHDHVTGEPRSVVCNSCNVVEGHGIERIRKVLVVMRVWRDKATLSTPPVPGIQPPSKPGTHSAHSPLPPRSP